MSGVHFSKPELVYIREAVARGDGVDDIAEHLHRNIDTVSSKLRRLGLKVIEPPSRHILYKYRRPEADPKAPHRGPTLATGVWDIPRSRLMAGK